jgi:Gram-negative bacterial TonB protein C-terminal
MSNRLLIPFPEEFHSTPAVSKRFGGIADDGAYLLELRTESGVLYVCPSRWERIRLRWAFRHFYVLPPQVLSRRNQLLIEKLSQSALVTPPHPVARETIFGVVEKARTKSTDARRVIPMPAPDPAPHLAPAKNPASVATVAAKSAAGNARDDGFRQWRALGLLAAVCLVVILGRISGVFVGAKTPAMEKAPVVSRPIEHAAARVSPPVAALPVVPKTIHPAPPAPAPKQPLVAEASKEPLSGPEPPEVETRPAAQPVELRIASTAPSMAPEPLFVSGLPQGHLVEPVVSDPNLVGELHLKALIGADGAVKDVTVVSGNPKLAEAGMRAVRRWHYGQYQALGRQGEGEALIRMNFFGEDAVSITSDAR